jgi:hypothetical protein
VQNYKATPIFHTKNQKRIPILQLDECDNSQDAGHVPFNNSVTYVTMKDIQHTAQMVE